MATKSDGAASAQHEIIGAAQRSGHAHTEHPDAQWFGSAGLGLFIHWGLSSVEGTVDLSWGMIRNTSWDWQYLNTNKMRPSEYFAQADRFDPENYDPDLWLSAAARAGVKYAVLTTRHHEGYALWPSKYGNFSTRTHMHGRDLVREFADACRRHGLKVGFYYSPPDWRFTGKYRSFGFRTWDNIPEQCARMGLVPDCPTLDENWQPCEIGTPDEAFLREYAAYLRGQITELLTEYGKVDVLWFDGAPDLGVGQPGSPVPMPITMEEIRSMQPGIVVNPRMYGEGDFETPECRMPDEQPKGWWEGCFTWNRNWGYTKDESYKPLGWLTDLLARHRAWDGNLLISCGPRGDGRMPENYYRRMEELSRWMDRNKEAVFGAQGGLWPGKSSLPATRRGSSWYLFMDGDVPAVLKDTPGKPVRAVLMGSGEEVPCVPCENGEVMVVLKVWQKTGDTAVVRVDWE